MLLSLVFPIADARLFKEPPEARLVRPMWPAPDADSEFVRSFGRIRTQPGRRVKDWVGESAACDARVALRFLNLDKSRVNYPWGSVGYEGAYRSLFADGLALCKFEIGCMIIPKLEKNNLIRNQIFYADKEIISNFLNLSVNISIPEKGQTSGSLFSSKATLARAYRIATSCNSIDSLSSDTSWTVRPCSSLILLEFSRPSEKNPRSTISFRMPHGAKRITVQNTEGIFLHYFPYEHERQEISVWCISLPENRTHKQLNIANKIKLYLLRLHTEKTIYNHILTCIATKKINPPSFSEASQSLQQYLNESTRKILRYESRSKEMLEGFWGRKVKLAEESIFPNARELLLKRLETIGVRNNLVRKVAQLDKLASITENGNALTKNMYIDFAPADAADAQELIKRLKPLEDHGHIKIFDEGRIIPGSDIQKTINAQLAQTNIFIPLVSADYLASEACQQRLNICRTRGIAIVPILVRAVHLDYSAVDGLALLPQGGIPLRSQPDLDGAWAGIMSGLLHAAGIPPSVKGKAPSLTPDVPKAEAVSIPKASIKQSAKSKKVDIAIITTLRDEYAQVRHFLQKEGDVTHVPGRSGKGNLYAWTQGQVQPSDYDRPFEIVLAVTGRQANLASMTAVLETIDRFRPRYILLVGIAGGIHRDGVRKGSIVVSSSINYYESGKLDAAGFHPRSDLSTQPDVPLLTAAMYLASSQAEWYRDLSVPSPSRNRTERPNVVTGPIGSGDKLIDNINDPLFERIIKEYPELIAIEMEAAGVMAAIQHNREKQAEQCDFTMIRGISDMVKQRASKAGNEKALEQDLWKKYASSVAACFAIKLIKYAWPVPPR